jgi:DNA-binding response OmpR family regulator
VLLDLMLPGVDGMDILRRLRAMGNPVHILVISARDGLENRLEALDAGADDYLVKPFPLAEALARTRALLRRAFGRKYPLLRVADLEIDPGKRTASRAGEPIELTALEYRLLEYLAYRSGEVVPRTDIWEHVFEDGTGGGSNAVDVYIGYLRKKLNFGDRPDLIRTRRGQGYVLEEPEV